MKCRFGAGVVILGQIESHSLRQPFLNFLFKNLEAEPFGYFCKTVNHQVVCFLLHREEFEAHPKRQSPDNLQVANNPPQTSETRRYTRILRYARTSSDVLPAWFKDTETTWDS